MKTNTHKKCLICNSPQLQPMQGYEEAHLCKCRSCGFVFSKQIPSKEELIVLGNGMLLPTLKDKCKNESIKNVQFLGRVPYKDLMAYTQIADLGINLIEPINESKRLSLPNKLFEYMSVGVPFLSNDLPEPKLLVEKYNCGVLVDYSDTQSIVDRIQELSKNKSLLKNLGSNGQKAIQEELNWTVEFEGLMKELA